VSVVVVVCPIFATASPPSTAVEGRVADANQAAWEAFHQRDFPRCEQRAREAWQLAEADRDSLQAAVGAANLAAAVAMRGRLDEALEWSRRAEERLGPDPQPLVRGRILVAQAILQKVRGEDEASAQAFRRAREALGPEDWSLAFADALAEGYDWEDLGTAYQRIAALRDRARGAAEPEPKQKQKALALLDLGWIEGVGGGLGAVKPFEEARTIFASAGHTEVLPLVDHNLGSLFLWADRLDEAQTTFERGLAAARAVRDRRLEVILLDDLSQLFSQKEDWPLAVAADREAGARLAAIAEDVRQGRIEDSLLLDLRRLFKARYVHKPQMLAELFLGLFEQLAVEPRAAGSGS
jgi:tetratricopeptide (TPR) repeat protein